LGYGNRNPKPSPHTHSVESHFNACAKTQEEHYPAQVSGSNKSERITLAL
jgi:hypothetical protein